MSSAPAPAIRSQPFTDRMLQLFQSDVIQFAALALKLPFLRGAYVVVGPISAAGTFTVIHGLKRKPQGFVVLDALRTAGATGQACVYRRRDDELSETRLVLYASASFESVGVWVF
jgi:hypothetical protein